MYFLVNSSSLFENCLRDFSRPLSYLSKESSFFALKDKEFSSFFLVNLSFKNLINASINNTYYGKYSKLNNLAIIVDNLEKKELNSTMTDLINNICDNMDSIKNDILNNNSRILNNLINSHLD